MTASGTMTVCTCVSSGIGDVERGCCPVLPALPVTLLCVCAYIHTVSGVPTCRVFQPDDY